MSTFDDVYPKVQSLGHRASTVTGGHPLMGNPGAHALPRNYGVMLRYVMALLLSLIGVLLVLAALHLFGQPSTTATVPVPQVSVVPSSCTFPDGS